jgi:membrane-associated phospholipid phosphatase
MVRSETRAKHALKKVERTDLEVTRKVSLSKRRPAGRWMRRFAEIGDQPPLVAISLGVVAAGLVGGHGRLRRTGFRMLTAHSLSTIAKMIGKGNIDRTRPRALGEKAYRLEKGDSRDGRLRSMPSGHSAGIVAVAGAISADYPRALLPLAAASAAIGAAQVPSRNHFLSDVVVGAGIGFAAAALAHLLIPPSSR